MQMRFPSLAIDGSPEPPQLFAYHQKIQNSSRMFFMPKTEEELNLYYDLYKRGLFSKGSYVDLSELWDKVRFGIREEIEVRSLDGNLFFIDKFLDHLNTFVSLMTKHPDKGFTKLFFDDPDTESFVGCLWSQILLLNNFAQPGAFHKEGCSYESLHLTHIVTRLDEILKTNGIKGNLLSLYKTLCLGEKVSASEEKK